MPSEIKYPLFIELTDTYNGERFCLNADFIRSIRNNGRKSIIHTADTQYSVYESYDEIVKKIIAERNANNG